MSVDISVLVGGEAGQGIQTVGHLMARTCHAGGLYVMMINDFESRIRGAAATVSFNFASETARF
jgi:2-oxoglutarate ferredoxin oxidoreductase subunit alpha